ncbi:MAG: nucleotidyltransferase domain-containing protein [Candidatus Brennerbacteria bacterium]|nr:nucleotidyltransferase domain-containing protein [Candidatus Brennerbacteria bacterium]
MRLEHYPVKKLKKEVLEIIKKRLDIKRYKVFFFGSRISGKNNELSDIDIGIDGHNPISTRAWLDIQEDIENIPTLYKIDIVDFQQTAEKFRKVALKKTESLL